MKEKNYASAIEESMRETQAVFVFACIAELVLGCFLIFSSYVTMVLSIVIGAILTGVGVFNIISYLMSRTVPFRQGLFSGVIYTAFGISFITQAENLKIIMPIVFGTFMVFEGLSCCLRSLLMRRLDDPRWYIPFITSIAICVLGTVMLVFPGFFGDLLEMMVGIVLVIEAGLGLWTIFALMYRRKKLEEYIKTSSSIVEVKSEK